MEQGGCTLNNVTCLSLHAGPASGHYHDLGREGSNMLATR
jgi:hypothetical protein